MIERSEDDIPSIVIVSRKPSSRKTTPSSTAPKSPRPEFLEPLSVSPSSPHPSSPYESLGMTEAEYEALRARVFAEFREQRKRELQEKLLAELKAPAYWLRRIELLEKEREPFNKKWGWSAAEQTYVESLDEQIKECEDELDLLYNEEEMMEYMCD